MKKLFYLFLAISLIFAGCKKEDDAVAPASSTYTKIYGCTDASAVNFNASANVYVPNICCYTTGCESGCTDESAVNYNFQATIDDGSCIYPTVVYGCADTAATNYGWDCSGSLPYYDQADNSCCIYSGVVYGCTDSQAINYDPLATIEPNNACDYTCDVVYYLDYSAVQYMLNNNISYYSFYDYNGSNLGYITSDWYWTSPPNCVPQTNGSTLTTSLYWTGNSGGNTATFSWSAYPNDGPIADYSGSFLVTPNECAKVHLSKKKIQDYKESK